MTTGFSFIFLSILLICIYIYILYIICFCLDEEKKVSSKFSLLAGLGLYSLFSVYVALGIDISFFLS